MNTNGINALDFETGTLELINSPAERSRSVSTREDVLVHEKTPDEILVLPRLAETGVLHEEDSVIVEHVVDLLEEGGEVTDTDVLGHFQTGDLVVLALGDGGVAVVHAENTGLLLGNADLAKASVAPGSLVAAESNTGDLSAIVGRCELGKSTPTAAEIEHALASLEGNLLTDDGQLVVLELFKRLFLVDVRDDTGSVDHAGTEEPAVEVVTAVVVVADLLLVLGASVHDNLWHHASQEEPEQADSETEVGPVVAVLHDLQCVTVEVDLAIKVLLVEGLHGDLVAAVVLGLVFGTVEGEIVLNWCTGVLGLLVLAGSVSRSNGPEGDEDWEAGQDGEENPCLETAIDLPGEVPRYTSNKTNQDLVVERLAAGSISWERSVLDGWELKRVWLATVVCENS